MTTRVVTSSNDDLAERTDLTGPRASALVRCARWCMYGASGAQRDPERDSPGTRERGSYLGAAIADYDAAQQARMGYEVIREMEVPWPRWTPEPLGTGHIDVFRTQGGEVREISTRADAQLDGAKALQAALYALNTSDAQQATVAVYDPSNWRKAREYGLDLERLQPIVRGLEQALVDALASGELPPRVCAYPEDPAGRFCPFHGVCFDGWEAPSDKDASFLFAGELALMVVALDARSAAKEALAEAEAKVKELASVLDGLPASRWIRAGADHEVRRRQVKGRRTFDLAGYEAAGHQPDPAYVRQGDPYTTWDKPRLADDDKPL